MSRQLTAIALSFALISSGVSTATLSAPALPTSALEQPALGNHPPLPPGAAAGIKQAQGENIAWLSLGVITALIIVAWIVIDDEDDENDIPSTTGT
jgi:hypothetical protein